MKKAEKLSEIRIGQKVSIDEKGENSFKVRLVEDKLVPYIVTDDNRCHPLYRGIWIMDK
ncbi:MAG: hypothetical protein IJI46_09765 [Erysipelotrichaceae bacterium]|nr:hypothetical protein [Erysipelotrichaceae bacterium]